VAAIRQPGPPQPSLQMALEVRIGALRADRESGDQVLESIR
jgi:hypothetical protein